MLVLDLFILVTKMFLENKYIVIQIIYLKCFHDKPHGACYIKTEWQQFVYSKTISRQVATRRDYCYLLFLRLSAFFPTFISILSVHTWSWANSHQNQPSFHDPKTKSLFLSSYRYTSHKPLTTLCLSGTPSTCNTKTNGRRVSMIQTTWSGTTASWESERLCTTIWKTRREKIQTGSS